MKVVTLAEETVEGILRPVVPGAVLVKPEADGWYTAHFEPLRHAWIHLLRKAPGQYATFPHPPPGGELPDLGGEDWETFKADHANLRDWPAWKIDGEVPGEGGPRAVVGLRVRLRGVQLPPQAARPESPWRIRGMRIDRAVPTLPSLIGSVTLDEVE